MIWGCDSMFNNKGQALVEFIILIPIFMFLVLGIIDFGNILYQKYELGSELDIVVDLYKQDKLNDIDNYLSDKHITVNYSSDGNLKKIKLSKSIDVLSPGLNLVLGDTYIIYVERVIYYEK